MKILKQVDTFTLKQQRMNFQENLITDTPSIPTKI